MQAQTEKEQLLKESKIRKKEVLSFIFRGADNLPYEKVGNNEPVCIADKVPFAIPGSWEWVRLVSISGYDGKKRSMHKLLTWKYGDAFS